MDLNNEKIVNDLINITNSIKVLYDKLYKLTIKGKTETEEYKKIYDYLSISLDIEEDIYSKLNLSYNNLIEILTFISKKLKNEPIMALINRNYSNIVKYRISKNLLSLILGNKLYYQNYALNLMIGDFDTFEIEEGAIDYIASEVDLNFSLNDDISYSFVIYLQELIDNDLYSIYKNKLIKTKFAWSFIENDINVINNIYPLRNVSRFDVLARYYDYTYSEKNDYVKETQSKYLKENIDKFMKLANKNDLSDVNYTKLLLLKCHVSSILEAFDISDLITLERECQEFITVKHLDSNNPLGSGLLLNSINDVIENKCLILSKTFKK